MPGSGSDKIKKKPNVFMESWITLHPVGEVEQKKMKS